MNLISGYIKKTAVLIFIFYDIGALSLRAETQPLLKTELAPHSESLFASLRADPRELHFGLRLATPENQRLIAEVAIGHY